VPVHVDMNPPIAQAAEVEQYFMAQVVEQQFMAELSRVTGIINRLKRTSRNVIRLMRRLRENVNADQRALIEDQLTNEFKAALRQAGVSPGMVPQLAMLLAHTTVEDIDIVTAQHGDSIVVYFLCKTIKTLYKLGQMIVSGFMHVVFAVAIESLARTTVDVDVYVRADEFNFKLLCLSTPQDRGTSIPGMVFVVIYCCRRLRQPRQA